jgi:hypothetical protein
VKQVNSSHTEEAATSFSSEATLKSCMRCKSSETIQKNVSFSSIEIREYPRILGDNPSVKRGPALSLGWYSRGRVTKLSVNEFEKLRSPKRRKCPILSSHVRKRILQEEAGVTLKQMYVAKKEASKIKRSRHQSNALQDYDDAAVVFESCARTFTSLVFQRSYLEWEVQELMEQAERAKPKAK